MLQKRLFWLVELSMKKINHKIIVFLDGFMGKPERKYPWKIG